MESLLRESTRSESGIVPVDEHGTGGFRVVKGSDCKSDGNAFRVQILHPHFYNCWMAGGSSLGQDAGKDRGRAAGLLFGSRVTRKEEAV